MVPVFGHSFQNSAGKSIDLNGLCARDHLLMDHQQRFISTFNDFVNVIDARQLPKNFEQHLEQLHQIKKTTQ